MKESLKEYVSLIKQENDKKHKFSVLMHTISKEDYSSKLQSFYGIESNVREMLEISESCMFYDNESEEKFSNWIMGKD